MRNLATLEKGIRHIKQIRDVEKTLTKLAHAVDPYHTNYMSLGLFETAYIELLKEALDDTSDWISYFVYDCEMGEKPKKVTPKNEKSFELKTLKQLYALIIYDK
jgi:hypothetical protein